jgi:hypothetical protein
VSALRWTRPDTWALAVALLAVVAGALFYPAYYAAFPHEAMRAQWRDPALFNRLRDQKSEPLWQDGAGNALPPGYPENQGGKTSSENFELFEKKLGGYPGRETGQHAPDERWPALPSVPTDAWGHPYWLTVSWGAKTWGITSSGPDGHAGTGDDLPIFGWRLQGVSMSYPMRVDVLIYLGAFLLVWLHLVVRSLGLPRLAAPWEVVRAVVIVSPIFAVLSCLMGAARVRLMSAWDELQVAPAWLSISLTLSAVCVGLIVWRRTRPVAEKD